MPDKLRTFLITLFGVACMAVPLGLALAGNLGGIK